MMDETGRYAYGGQYDQMLQSQAFHEKVKSMKRHQASMRASTSNLQLVLRLL